MIASRYVPGPVMAAVGLFAVAGGGPRPGNVVAAGEAPAAAKARAAAWVRLPAGWKYGTALPVGRETAERVEFAPVSLTTLVDSPVLAGAHFHTFPLTTAAPPHQVHAAADSEAALEAPPPVVAGWKS